MIEDAVRGDFRHSRAGTSIYGGSSSYQEIYCAQGSECRSKFVEVNLNDGEHGARCSGVLLAKDLVLTNRHCARFVVSHANLSFGRGSIDIVLPKLRKTDANNSISLVQNLVLISPDSVPNPLSSPDWAILGLDPSFPLPADVVIPRISREGIKDGETYTVYAKSPFGDAKEPDAIEKRQCKAVYKTIFAPWQDRPLLPVFELSDCPIGPGNSGSPIFDKAGALVGIIGGQFAPSLLQSLSELARHWNLIDSPTGLANVGWGMSLACIPDLDDPHAQLPADCDEQGTEIHPIQLLPEAISQSERALDEAPKNTDVFRFKNVRATPDKGPLFTISQMLELSVPDCIHAAALDKLDGDNVTLDLNKGGIMFSSVGRPTATAAKVQGEEMTLKFDRRLLSSSKRTALTVTVGKDIVLYRGDLEICEH